MSFSDLKTIHDLIKLGHYTQALAAIERLPPNSRLEGEIISVDILIQQGELLQAKERSLALTETRFENPIQELRALLCYGDVLFRLQEGYACGTILTQAKEVYSRQVITSQTLDQEIQSSLAFLSGFLHFGNGEGPQAIEAFEKGYHFQQRLENPFKRIVSATWLAYSLREFSEQKKERSILSRPIFPSLNPLVTQHFLWQHILELVW